MSMTLTHRKPRPIRRDIPTLRDAKLFIIACDDTYAPEQYFSFFPHFSRVQIHVIPTTDGSSVAKHVLERLLEIDVEDYDDRWMILDTDHCLKPQHFSGFEQA
jgi:hypothetical protein